MKVFFLVLSIIGLVAVALYTFVASTLFDINCGDRMKRVADANTIELAREEMAVVIGYLEANDLTHGSTHILWAMPKYDIASGTKT